MSDPGGIIEPMNTASTPSGSHESNEHRQDWSRSESPRSGGSRSALRGLPDPESSTEGSPRQPANEPSTSSGDRATAVKFAESVRQVTSAAQRRQLSVPVFRSPPRVVGVDRTILWRDSEIPVVSVRLSGRPMPAVQADIIEGIVTTNQLAFADSDSFRREAWDSLSPPDSPTPPSRVPRLRAARVA